MARCSIPFRWCVSVVLALTACSPQLSRAFLFLSPALPRAGYHRAAVSSASCRRSGGRLASAAGESQSQEGNVIPPSLDRSAPPVFIAKNNVSLDKEFIVSKEGEPTAEELTNENVIKILAQSCTDEEVNFLLWKCLGYRYDVAKEGWLTQDVFPKWREKFPEPPDLIGVTRIYEREVDQVVMKANQSLVRAIPREHKTSLMDHLRKVGFTGYSVNELTPNRTRRAQAANFIIYYREQLWGVSLEELQRRQREKQETARKPLLPDETADSTPPPSPAVPS